MLNAIRYGYKNGLLEGIVNKLKVLKRQVYGRAEFDLLEKKLYL
ncbi:transposase [Cetobacterium sp.]